MKKFAFILACLCVMPAVAEEYIDEYDYYDYSNTTTNKYETYAR